MIASGRRELAEILAGLDRCEWDPETLCDGWRVREVLAHVTEAFRYSGARKLWELVKAGGRFNRMADRNARRDAARMGPDQLTAAVRDNLNHPWKPVGGGFEAR